jgi:hypothetical protein
MNPSNPTKFITELYKLHGVPRRQCMNYYLV